MSLRGSWDTELGALGRWGRRGRGSVLDCKFLGLGIFGGCGLWTCLHGHGK